MIILCFFIGFLINSLAAGIYFREQNSDFIYEEADIGNIKIDIKGEGESKNSGENSFCQLFFVHHLVFGQFRKYYIPIYKRTLLLTANIPFLLVLNGLIFMAFEDIDEATSNDESDFLEYLWISVVSSLIARFFTFIVDYVEYKNEKDQQNKGNAIYVVLIGFMFALSVLGVGIMIFEYCLDWSKIWCLLFLFSVLFSGLVLETITSLIKIAFKLKIE